MADLRKSSSTSNLVRFVLKNSTTGVGLTGLSIASSGLIISTIADNEATATAYTVAGSTIESITTLGTYAAPTATKCRFKEVDATNHKGLYEFQFADARFAVASSRRLIVSVTGATNLLDADYEIQLVQFDPYATSLGLVLAKTTNLTGFNDIAATAIVSSGAITTSGGAVSTVTAVGTLTTYTGNTPQTGDSFARIGATGSGLTSLASSTAAVAIQAKTDLIPASPAAVGSAMTLTSGERTAIANEVEAQIIDETDSEKVLTAITNKIASVNPSLGDLTLSAIAASVVGHASFTSLASNVTAALADTNELQTDWVNGGRLDLLIDAIKAKSDNLPSDPADASDIATSFSTVSTTLATIAGYIDTEISAIKAKTDNLPASPAAVGSIPTAAQIRAEMDAFSTKLAQLAGAFTGSTSVFTAASLVNAPAGEGGGGGGATVDEIAEAVWGEVAVNTTTHGEIHVAVAAVLCGKATENATHTATEFSDINDPDTIRINSTNFATERTPTVN